MSTVTQMNIAQSMAMQNLLDNSRVPEVYDLSGGYRQIGALIDALNIPNGGSYEVESDIYEKFVLGKGHRIAQVQSTQVVGTLLQVNLSNSQYDAFLPGDIILCKNTSIQAHVVNSAPGVITVQPSGVTLAQLQGSGGIVQNNYVRAIGVVSETRLSDAPGSLNETPDKLENRCQVRRSSWGYSRRDRKLKSFPIYKNGYWSQAQIDLTIQRHLKDDEFQKIWSINTGYSFALGGEVDRNGGIDWAIKTRGGVHYALTTAPTRTQFERFLLEMWDRKAARSGPLTLVMGRAFYNHISGFADNYIVNAGKNNTFFAEKGLNVKIYAVGGTEYNLVVLPVLNDIDIWPETSIAPGLTGVSMKSMTCYCLDFTPIDAQGRGKLPAIENIHRGDSRWYAGWMSGIDKARFDGMSVDDFLSASSNVATMKDGSTFGILSDCGIDTPGEFHGLMELIQ